MEILQLILDNSIQLFTLIVSYLVYLIYKKQTKLQERLLEVTNIQKDNQNIQLEYFKMQVELQKISFEPIFKISTHLKNNNSDEILIIENDGYYISDFKSKITTIFTLEVIDLDKKIKNEYSFVANGYFACGHVSNCRTNQKGILVERFDNNNNINFTNLYFDAINNSTSKKKYLVSKETIVELEYVNYENLDCKKYYFKKNIFFENISSEFYQDKIYNAKHIHIDHNKVSLENIIQMFEID